MEKSRYTAEEIAFVLRRVEEETVSAGMGVAEEELRELAVEGQPLTARFAGG